MALGTTIDNKAVPNKEGNINQSMTSGWVTVISAGGPATQDAATITNPDTQITTSTRSIFRRRGAGTILLLRLGYDDGLTSITNPIVKVFGRTDLNTWMVLKDVAGNLTVTLTTAASTDVADGTLLYTAADVASTSIDCLGCEEILIGVQTALAGTGTVSNSIIQVKVL